MLVQLSDLCSVLFAASILWADLILPRSPEFKELMATTPYAKFETFIPHYASIPPMPERLAASHITDFIPTRTTSVGSDVSVRAMTPVATSLVPITKSSRVQPTQPARREPARGSRRRACPAAGPVPGTAAVAAPTATTTATAVSPPSSLRPPARQSLPSASPRLRRQPAVPQVPPADAPPIPEVRFANAVPVPNAVTPIAVVDATRRSGSQVNTSYYDGVVLGAVGASGKPRAFGSPANHLDTPELITGNLPVAGSGPADLNHHLNHNLKRHFLRAAPRRRSQPATVTAASRAWESLSSRQRSGCAYILGSAAAAVLMIMLQLVVSYAPLVAERCLRLNLVDVLARAKCATVRGLVSGVCQRGLGLYREALISLLVSSPMCIYFRCLHEPAAVTEQPETGLLAAPDVAVPLVASAGPLAASAVPKLESTSAVANPWVRPRTKVARRRLVSVSSPRRTGKVHPPPLPLPAQAEKDGVDHKDTFAFAFVQTDPWACDLVSTLLQIQDKALSPPVSERGAEKTGLTRCRDDDEAVRPLRVKKRKECMPSFPSQPAASRSGGAAAAAECLDVGTRVANCQALGRYHADRISSIFEGSNQARCAVFSLTAEVGRTESLRKYKEEIEYIESAARRDPQLTQSQCSAGFDLVYADPNYKLIIAATDFQRYAVAVSDKIRGFYADYETKLKENAKYITVPEPEKITELVNMYFETQNSSIAKQLRTIEAALRRRADIDETHLEHVQPLYEILNITAKDYTNACYDYIDADENRWQEVQPDYYSWLLTRRVSAYRMLPM